MFLILVFDSCFSPLENDCFHKLSLVFGSFRKNFEAFDFEGSTILIEIIFIISIQKVSLYNTFLSSGFLQRKLKDIRFNLKRNAVCPNSRNYFISIYWNERWFEKAGSYLYILLNSLQGLTLLSTGRVLCIRSLELLKKILREII